MSRKPILRYERAWHVHRDDVGCPSVRVVLHAASGGHEHMTVHGVLELKFNDHGSIIRFETKHKIFVQVKS
ncbi:hypothetical protein CPT_Piffle_015 [Stenotrophomonas phage Piffle]|uniref:Uncharacterized protein n=1 Tax=Stenotrophomonas phage Piffle TaxID=2859656 RepID=A0AAE7WLY9_9CAUD|nr:hypothetical protein PP762_gp15 [Stenotrophomonas phage Piffle]QYW01875.1 hypothetical protein CPT_Piffle_015 [Stenotrophomonas phage Piffle]